MMSIPKDRRLLDKVREYMRLHHYSIHTERTYCDWIKKYVRFHNMQSRDDLSDGEEKIERFLTHLAVRSNVSPATQNQAMNALVFLYKKVLRQPLDDEINAVRATRKAHIPVVMTREETAQVIALIAGTPQLAVKLMHGGGLRISETIRLRVHDIDYELKTITVRSGKGGKDRITPFPASVDPFLSAHLAKVKRLHERDLAEGFGEVYMPHALARKYRKAGSQWGWQYVFPASKLSKDPRSKIIRHFITQNDLSQVQIPFDGGVQEQEIAGSSVFLGCGVHPLNAW